MTNYLRVRSHRFPKEGEIYTDTTYHDRETGWLDIGYQNLKRIDAAEYSNFSNLTIILMDYNALTELPNPDLIPNIKRISARCNKILYVPYYGQLRHLNIAENSLETLDTRYANEASSLYDLDVSFNPGFNIKFKIPSCQKLYINNNAILALNLSLFPNLIILDCSCNLLTNIDSQSTLEEINIQDNSLTTLPAWPSMKRIIATDNKLKEIPIYPYLTDLIVANNRIESIINQPLLEKLIANKNRISEIRALPKLQMADLSNNLIKNFIVESDLEWVDIFFNPMTSLDLPDKVFGTLNQMQLNLETYVYICKKCHDRISEVIVKVDGIRLRTILHEINSDFSPDIIDYVYHNFNEISQNTAFRKCSKIASHGEHLEPAFQSELDELLGVDLSKIFKTEMDSAFGSQLNRLLGAECTHSFYRITMCLYWLYYRDEKVKSISEITMMPHFHKLMRHIIKLYIRNVIVQVTFNRSSTP